MCKYCREATKIQSQLGKIFKMFHITNTLHCIIWAHNENQNLPIKLNFKTIYSCGSNEYPNEN